MVANIQALMVAYFGLLLASRLAREALADAGLTDTFQPSNYKQASLPAVFESANYHTTQLLMFDLAF